MDDWIEQRINLVHLSTGGIPTEKKYLSQRSARPSNHSWVQCLHHVPQCQLNRVYKGWCPDNEHINTHSVACQT